MMPFLENDTFQQGMSLFCKFVATRSYAFVLFGVLLGCGYYLRYRFTDKVATYTALTPPECYFLTLQCQRWQRHAHQVVVVMWLSIPVAFVMFLFAEMVGDVLSQDYIKSLQFMLFVGIVSFKVRALWYIYNVLTDFVKAAL